MKKLYLEDVIEKYYLNGLVERVKINIENKTLTTKFISNQKNLVGSITAPDMELNDCEFGIYDTTQLLKLIGITDHFLTLEVAMQGKVATKLLILFLLFLDSYFFFLHIWNNCTFKPNSGSSMKDQLSRLEKRVDDLFILISKS